MDNKKEDRINEIDQRIKDLREHMVMWGQAGGRGIQMMTDASREIEDLQLEKEDLLNGTNKLEIAKNKRQLKRLKLLREDAILLQKMIYSAKIKKTEKMIQSLEGTQIKR